MSHSGTDDEELDELMHLYETNNMSPRSDASPVIQRRDPEMAEWLARMQWSSPSPSPPRRFVSSTDAVAPPATPPPPPLIPRPTVIVQAPTPPSPSLSMTLTASPSPPKLKRYSVSPNESPGTRTRINSGGPGHSRRRIPSGRRPIINAWTGNANNNPPSSTTSILLSPNSPPPGCSRALFARPASPSPQPGPSKGSSSADPFYQMTDKVLAPWKRNISPDCGSDGSGSSTGIEIQRVLLKSYAHQKAKNSNGNSPNSKNGDKTPHAHVEAEGIPDTPEPSSSGPFVSEDLRALERAEEKARRAHGHSSGDTEQLPPVRVELFGPTWSVPAKESWLQSLREIDPVCKENAARLAKSWTPGYLQQPGDFKRKHNSNSSSDTSTDVVSNATTDVISNPTPTDDSSSKDKEEKKDEDTKKRSSF